jgi:hypothetical protein
MSWRRSKRLIVKKLLISEHKTRSTKSKYLTLKGPFLPNRPFSRTNHMETEIANLKTKLQNNLSKIARLEMSNNDLQK